MTKKVKRITLDKAIEILDHWFELYVRIRDNWTCIVCGKQLLGNTSDMHAGHLISRRHKLTRWDEDNVNAQCKNCNCLHTHNEALYTAAYIKKYGQEKYLNLVSRHRGTAKMYPYELLIKAEEYKQKVIPSGYTPK